MKPLLWGERQAEGAGQPPRARERRATRNTTQHHANQPGGVLNRNPAPPNFRSFTMTPKLVALTETFTAALYSMSLQSRGGDYYAFAYINYATNELVSRALDLESDFMPFLESAASTDSRVFNEWVDSEVPLRIDELAELWIKRGCPEPEYYGQGGIEERIRHAVRYYIAERARDAAGQLGALLAEFKDQLDALDADELYADELDDGGLPDRYAGLYMRRVTVDGIVLTR